MFGYRVPAPDEAMLITGGSKPTRVVVGRGAWLMPGLRKVRYLSLSQYKVTCEEKCVTNEGLLLGLRAVVAFKVQNDTPAILQAQERFLRGQQFVEDRTKDIFAGHVRSIIGGMTIKSVMTDRETFKDKVLTGCQADMSVMGMTVDTIQIEDINDCGSGYIEAWGRPHLVNMQRDADVAAAEAQQISVQAQQASERKQAEFIRDTKIQEAQFKAETDKANAVAAQAGPLSEAEAQQKVIDTQREVAERNALLREQELMTEVIKPAEAERQRLRIEAEGEALAAEQEALRVAHEAEGEAQQTRLLAEARAEATKVTASANAEQVRVNGEAAAYAKTQDAEATRAQRMAEADGAQAMANANASNDGYLLRLKEIEIQPEIARALANGLGQSLSTANITMFEGASDLQKLFTTVAQQGSTLFHMFRSGLATPEEHPTVPNSPASLVGSGNNTPVQK